MQSVSYEGDVPLATSNVRVGLISTSWFAGMFHIPLTQSHEGVDLVSICGRDKTNAAEMADQHGIENVYTDYRTLVDSDDLDAVIVATPDDCHHEMTYMLSALESTYYVKSQWPRT